MTDWLIQPLRREHDRTEFCCGITSLDEFLKLRVNPYEHRNLGRTFVAINAATNKVSGYYTIVAGSVPFEFLPNDLSRKLPRHPVPVALIGRLAVGKESQGRLLGEKLLLDSMARSKRLSKDLGIYAVQVDAIDDKAISFYRKYGFVPLQDQPQRLILPIKSIASVS